MRNFIVHMTPSDSIKLTTAGIYDYTRHAYVTANSDYEACDAALSRYPGWVVVGIDEEEDRT